MRRFFMFGDFSDRCPPCDESRRLAREQQQKAEQEKRMIRLKEERILSRLRSCNIGERFMGMDFDSYKPTCEKAKSVMTTCREYVENYIDKSCNLLMIGSPGTGKNMLAGIIGQEIIKRDFSFYHTTAMKLVRTIKDSWKDREQNEQEIINSFISHSLLAIDEIGVQFGSATEQLYLTEVINERYEKRRPTILISNLTISQLTEVMGARVIDRFYDDGSKILVFDWPSYRRNKPCE